MKLNLKKPIAFFDLETTGIKVATDRIVEISIVKIHPDGKKEIKTRRINPERPIPPETSAIHGIYDEDVKDEPTFAKLAKSLDAFLKNCDQAGYNSNRFDIPLLAEEFLRAGIDFDVARYDYIQDARAQIAGRDDGLLKIIYERDSHRVIGVHALVEGADDLMGEAALAVKAGVPLEEVAGAIHPHPTLTESFGFAARAAMAAKKLS